MTHSDMTMLVRGMAPVLKDFVAGAIGPLQERIAILEQQLRETEQQAVSFRGVWEAGKSYGRHSAVVRSGSLWIAMKATSATPGGSDPADRAWVLAVKKGSV